MTRIKTVFALICIYGLLSFSPDNKEGFKHKGYLGWMIDISRTPHTVPWPSVILDQSLIDDYKETLGFLQRSRMNEITLWGLFTNEYWEPDVEKTIDAERATKVRSVIADAHQRGIKIICGVGVYSWGFNKIIKEHPEIKCPCNENVMDLSNPASWEWQKKVLDYLMDNFEFDGFSMQSADRGRCTCGEFAMLSNLEYHALLNQKVVDYIRSKKKDFIIGISGWGMNFSNPTDMKSIVKMTRNADYLIDVEETALKGGHTYRKELIEAIAPCAYGSTGTPNIEPIQALPRDQYFVPTLKRSCQRIKELYEDGGRACETYVHTRSNIGDKVTIEVMAGILNNPGEDIQTELKKTLKWMFKPIGDNALQEMATIFNNAEDAYFNNAKGDQEVILLMRRDVTTPSSHYLVEMTPSSRANYKTVMRDVYNRAVRLKDRVGNKEKYQVLLHCLEKVLKEIDSI